MTSAHRSDRAARSVARPGKRTEAGAPAPEAALAAPRSPKLPPPAPGGAGKPTAKLRSVAKLSPKTQPAAAADGDAAGTSSTTVPPATAALPRKLEPAKVKRAAKPETPAKAKAKAEPAKKAEPPAVAKSGPKAARCRAVPLQPRDEPKIKLNAKPPTAEKLEVQSRRPVESTAAAPVPDRSVPEVNRDASPAAAMASAELTSSGKPPRSRRGLGSLGKQAINRATPALQLLPRPQVPPAATPVRPASAGDQVGDAASLIAQARSLSGGAAGPASRHKDPVAFLRDELLALLALIEEPPEPPPSPHGSG